jgi:Pyruvate/2-oxoacid:ferredoxin oxidoreductase gamma subunit
MRQAHHFTYTALKTHKGENMTKPTRLIINCETKEQIEVELTDEEIAQLEEDRVKAEADKAERDAVEAATAAAKASAQAKLAALGLTAEEISALY